VKVAQQEHGKGKPRVKKGPSCSRQEYEEDSDGKSPFSRNASRMIDEVVNQISSFVDFVEHNAEDPGHRETLNTILDAEGPCGAAKDSEEEEEEEGC
jgi:hypothetical protein